MSSDETAFDPDSFAQRHIGPRDGDIAEMLGVLGAASLDALVDDILPRSIRLDRPPVLDPPRSEYAALRDLRAIAARNEVYRSLIGMGYYDCIVPAVIQRNILENPGWYTQYTPYQAEISQGRLEALLTFQTMVADLTGLPLANASLLDEATAAAEAMTMCVRIARGKRRAFYVAADTHPQTIAVMQTRAAPLEIDLRVAPPAGFELDRADLAGVLLQYPTTDGRIEDYADIASRAHAAGALVACATDLLALMLIRPPGAWGADIAVGSAQRFGVPLAYGGPHAAFMATLDKHARQMPGRIIGVSHDAEDRPAFRLAIQTREQHIRREKATSNICTAQALLAIMAGMYAVYHGPRRLRAIACRVHRLTATLADGLGRLGYAMPEADRFFDTLRVDCGQRAEAVLAAARDRRINLRDYGDGGVGVALDEKSTPEEVERLLACFAPSGATPPDIGRVLADHDGGYSARVARTDDVLAHPVFNTHHSETQMLRYLRRLEARDLSLTTSMIPLGSCTMKLNATSEMLPITWPAFADLHPFAPPEQARGYAELFEQLERWLAALTGLAAVSLQPNAGAQGEYSGLCVIRAYHASRDQGHRDVCLIPTSAHGTNPASSVMAGLRVVAVACDEHGNIDLADLKAKAEAQRDHLAALMITYPSTHGVFEEDVREICRVIHACGGQVYMDGANMNAQLGLCTPGQIGADVCHLNLHKTFCIPHGGGGPGVGPIAVAEHLAEFLPSHPLQGGAASPVGRAGRGASQDGRAGCGPLPDQVDRAPDKVGRAPDRVGRASRPTSDGPLGRRPSPDGRAGRGPLREASARSIGPVAAAPYGSAGILPISWMYIAMMGLDGLRRATQVAILNANYMAARLKDHYPVLYTGQRGHVAHEFIIDCRAFKHSAGIEVEDIAKRLMDYGFHAPTMSFPVPGTLMIEPTESEPKDELDRLCDALIAIRAEIRAIEDGQLDRDDNPLKNAPHTATAIAADDWSHPYSRKQAVYPAAWLAERKFWPPVARIDNAYGDRHLFCTCPTM